jgi:hypothetical protein
MKLLQDEKPVILTFIIQVLWILNPMAVRGWGPRKARNKDFRIELKKTCFYIL